MNHCLSSSLSLLLLFSPIALLSLHIPPLSLVPKLIFSPPDLRFLLCSHTPHPPIPGLLPRSSSLPLAFTKVMEASFYYMSHSLITQRSVLHTVFNKIYQTHIRTHTHHGHTHTTIFIGFHTERLTFCSAFDGSEQLYDSTTRQHPCRHGEAAFWCCCQGFTVQYPSDPHHYG